MPAPNFCFALLTIAVAFLIAAVVNRSSLDDDQLNLRVELAEDGASVVVYREGRGESILTQNAAQNFRPFLHPIMSPDGISEVTEFSPEHHRHQTGLYWGFTRLNGRDYFHHPEGDYWRRNTLRVLEADGKAVRWETVYDLLDKAGDAVLTETQTWAMTATDDEYVLDLEWRGQAHTDVAVGAYDYGGLFLRMPWVPGIEGRAINAARQRNQFAEGKRAMWLDVAMKLEGRDDLAHVVIFDHTDNADFPLPWRVDGQLGVGPVRARLGDWTINEGDTEVVRHQVRVYTGKMDDLYIRGKWESYVGQEGKTYSTASLWDIAQEEALEAEFLTGEEAARAMTLLDGYKVNAWASEPLVTQPMAFAWDDLGRLWVAENRDYESRQYGFSANGDSRIVILEDTNDDGKADSRTVFLEGIAFPAAIAIGFDGLFLGAPPHLLFVPDRDNDDKADIQDIEVLLTGWGIRDRHETINSLLWGPDGWLYGLEGFATPSKIRKPDGPLRLYGHGDEFPADLLEADGVDIDGGVWRYHPTKDRFEVVAHGFSNPWGIDYDARGQLFITACVIPHVFHVIPGGVYQRQGGRHFNPFVYDDIGPIVDHRHRSAHGGARVYQSDAFPAEQHGRLFMANIHEHAILTDILEPKGSGFVARHGDDFMMANNAQWVGFSVEVGPEGAVYVLDWHDADICGMEVLDKDTGRIFRITPTESHAVAREGHYDDLRTLSDGELADLQTSGSDWHTRRARIILQHRAAERALSSDAADKLLALYTQGPGIDLRLKGMWSLHVTGLLTQSMLIEALRDKEEYVRAWAVQMLHEDPGAPAVQLAAMAHRDDSPVVRKYLAAVLQRLQPSDRWDIAEGLLSRKSDALDHNIPTLVWLGVEPLVADNPERAIELAANSEMRSVSRYIARRLVDADLVEPLIAGLERLPDARADLLEGMLAGLEGRHDLETPANWPAVYETLKVDADARSIARDVARHFGDAEATRQYLGIVTSAEAAPHERQAALRSLAASSTEALARSLPELINDDVVRVEAIRAVAAFEDPSLGRLLLARYDEFDAAEKAEVVQTLASRTVYGRLLASSLASGRIPRTDVPAWVARQLRRVVGSGFVEIWGPIDELPGDQDTDYARFRALLTDEAIASTDVVAGRRVFERTCAVCHKMYDEGGIIGPDLTGSNRTNLDYLLGNMISPAEVMQDDYRMIIVTMRDGRTYIGNVSSENDRQLTLRVVGLPAVVLNKSNIQSREVSNKSLMPEGLLRALTDDEVRDLVAYLRTSEQVPLE